MTASTGATQSAQPQRPSLTHGVSSEFTILARIKPGHADALREFLETAQAKMNQKGLQDIGTVHSVRALIFDDDTRVLFATVFDGTWDTYIDDFAATSFNSQLDALFTHAEGYPGVKDPKVKDWFVANQVGSIYFTTVYSDLTVKQIWKDQRVNEAFQATLDAPEFRELLDNPASEALRATPAFQKLLNEAAG